MNDTNQSGLIPGQKVGLGRYTLVRKLGAGGMGVVWLAQDEHLREEVALKFLPPQVQEDKQALEGLRRETARAHKLTHSHIIRIHDFHVFPGEIAFISMEYVQGKTLGELRHEQSGGVFTWTTLAPLVKQLCEALDYAHGEGVIHRDLKPHNVMVDAKGRVRLADFGIAAVVSDSLSRVSVQHASSGTPAYMSPQQMNGKKPRVADDVYSLGATIYHLLTSQPPFYQGVIAHQVMNTRPDPLPERLRELEIKNDVPPEVGAVVLACLAKEPEQRPQSTAAVWTWLTSPEKGSTCTVANTIPALEITSAATRAEVLPTSPAQKPAVEATVADTPTATPTVVGRAVPSAPGQPDASKEHPDTNRLLTPQDASKERLAGDSEPYPPPGNSNPKPKSSLWLAFAACLLLLGVAGAWYFLKYQPEQERQRQVAAQQAQDAAEKKRQTDEAEAKRLAEEKIKQETEAKQLAAEKLKQEAEAKRLAEAKAQQDESRRKEAERIAAARGGLIVDTKPSGATATLGGEHIEKTPATFKGVKLGKFPLKLLLSGYEEVQREVEIKENEFLDLGTLTLMRSTGQLDIRSQPEAMDWQLKSDTGEIPARQGKTPSTLTNLPTGTYQVTLLRPGWPEYKGQASVARNQKATVQHEFAQGGLMITSDPKGAEAELGGKSIGKTPVAVPAVPVGDHELIVRFPGLAAQRKTVKVAKDATATADIKFPYGSVVVTSDPSGATVKANGSAVGTTPLTLDLVAVGDVNYQVELSSYKNLTVQGTVQAGQSARLTVKLEKAGPQLGERWTNSLGMVFAPVPGTKVLFGIWETRVQDFSAFAQDRANNRAWNYQSGAEPYILKSDGYKQRGWEYGWHNPGFTQRPDHPVTCVSWEDAQAFCQWLTQRDQAAGLLDKNQQYRLPTDTEWSQAVGLPNEGNGSPKDKDEKIKDVYPWGSQWPPPRGAGNYAGSEAKDGDWPSNFPVIEGYRDGFARTAPVGSFGADKNGLFDLSGNVWEWCEDWYDGDQKSRVLRGGSWGDNDSRGLLSSCRGGSAPGRRIGYGGFRCVLVVGGAVR
jgi:serine/threonine protein kinase/formylglycine-generating enzyme required for sulfatase activity